MVRRALPLVSLARMPCTGVPKSVTSKRRRRSCGSEVPMKSTTRFWPCCWILMPESREDRSTTTRPAPSVPRRKSILRSAARLAAWAGAGLAANVGAAVVPVCVTLSSNTTNWLPRTSVRYVAERLRFSTTRVRSPICITLALLSTLPAYSYCARPAGKPVSKKSIAIFAGFCVVKSAGFCASGPCRSTVNTVCSPTTLASTCLSWLV
ncbi:hypothetical protein D3C86_1101210 [compost metagenome]